MSTCAKECHPEQVEEKWQIPADVLGAMWGEILPRMVAYAWRDNDDLRAAINSLADFQGYMANLPPGSQAFQDVVAEVDAYITNAISSATDVPLDIPGDGGFDFVLSDCGVEMFIPSEPTGPGGAIEKLLRFYTFREPGRHAIGFPGFDVSGPREITSPTGPSQVRMRIESVVQNPCADQADDDCLATVMNCLALHLGIEDRFDADDIAELRRTEDAGPEKHDFTDRNREDEVELTLDSYMCALAPLRCWQISGAVFRGIMVTLPRIIAEIWHERALAGPPWNGNPNPGTLHTKFLTETRELFEERLETSIPDSEHMLFVTHDPNVSSWGGNVMITSRGISIPRPQDMDANPATAIDDIYCEIMNGRAGNPVFTDSRRSI